MGEGARELSGASFNLFLFQFLFWPSCVECGILAPHPGIKPVSSEVEGQSLNFLTAREIPKLSFCVCVCVGLFYKGINFIHEGSILMT